MAEAQPQAASRLNLPAEEATFLELNRQRRQAPALDRAADRWGSAGVTAQGSAPAVDQAIGKEAREQRLGSQLQRSRNIDRPKAEKGIFSAPSIGEAVGMAKMTSPVGMMGGEGGLKKKIEETSKQMLGGFIKSCWGALWITFGHAIYFIDILFLAQASSKYLRKYIPGVGEEWIPAQLMERIPKSSLIPLKMGEIVGMAFITFWVFMLDMLLVAIIAVLYAALEAFKQLF